MIVQLIITLPETNADREFIKQTLLHVGKHIKLNTSQGCDCQYREMDVPQHVLATLLRQESQQKPR